MSGLTATRVATTPDVGLIGEALKRPGMDTRVWSEQAIVEKIVIDADHGVLLDVICLATGVSETAKLFAAYNGNRYGLHLPVLVDDEVLVLAPMGEPDFGLIALPTSWDGADPPPQEIVDHPEDVVLVVREDTKFRLVLEGDGDAIIDPRGSGKVFLGGETGLQPAALGTDLEARISTLEASFIGHVHTGVTTGSGSTLATAPVPVLGTPTFQAAKVEVK